MTGVSPGDTLVPFHPNGITCTVLAVRDDGLLFLDWPGGMIAVPADQVATTHRIDNHRDQRNT